MMIMFILLFAYVVCFSCISLILVVKLLMMGSAEKSHTILNQYFYQHPVRQRVWKFLAIGFFLSWFVTALPLVMWFIIGDSFIGRYEDSFTLWNIFIVPAGRMSDLYCVYVFVTSAIGLKPAFSILNLVATSKRKESVSQHGIDCIQSFIPTKWWDFLYLYIIKLYERVIYVLRK